MMSTTAPKISGHLTIEKIVRAVSPTPISSPIAVTSGPVSTSAIRMKATASVINSAHQYVNPPARVRTSRAIEWVAATVLPRFPLMTQGAAEVSRLLEMCADDAATRRYGHRALLSGLLNLAGVAPAPALGAADVAVLTRIERLIGPPALHTRARAWAALAPIVAVLAAGPAITIAPAGAGLLMCGT